MSNRQSADRIVAGVRATQLERVQVERRLIESRLATTQAEIDPAAVLKQLAEIRNLYSAARPAADARLEAPIQEPRSVARTVTSTARAESAS